MKIHTIIYAAETWCLVAKLNSTQMDFWRRSARISRKDKIRNAIIKHKKWMQQGLFQTIRKPSNSNGMDMFKMEEGEITKRSYEMEPTRKKKTR